MMEEEEALTEATLAPLSSLLHTKKAAPPNAVEERSQTPPRQPPSPIGPLDESVDEKSVAARVPLPELPPVTGSFNLNDIITQMTGFLASASTPVLMSIGSLVALLSVVLLGRVGVFVLGVCGGMLGHALLQAQSASSSKSPLSYLSQFGNGPQARDSNGHWQGEHLDLSFLPTTTSAALSELIKAVVRDYIRHWYSPIVPSDADFEASCHDFLTDTVATLSLHISRKRPADLFLMVLYTASSNIIILARELAIISASTSAITLSDYVASQPDSAVAGFADRKIQERRLHLAADAFIDICVSQQARRFDPIATFLREILANVVFESMVDKFSESEWINAWIVYLLENESSESGSSTDGVGGLLHELDRGVTGAAGAKVPAVAPVAADGTAKRLSRADEAMAQAMKEAEELTRMIAEAELEKANEEAALQQKGNVEAENTPDLSSTELYEAPKTPIREAENTRRTSPETFGSPSSQKAHKPLVQFDQILEDEVPDVAESFSSERTYVDDDYGDDDDFQDYRELPKPSGVAPNRPARSTSISQQGPPSLLDARITITDLAPQSSVYKPLKSKPVQAYMVQIEPLANSGWIIMRKYSDFEALHEVLKRIASVSGVQRFLLAYSEDGLPTWKGRESDEVGALLEFYLRTVIAEPRLIDCDAFRRFMERDEERLARIQPNVLSAPTTIGPSWANASTLENVGKGMFGALTKAPQSVGEGSKALFGNVFSAVQGGVGLKRASMNQSVPSSESPTKAPLNVLSSKARGSVDSFVNNIIGLGGSSTSSSRAQSTNRETMSEQGLPRPKAFESLIPENDRGRAGYAQMNDDSRPALPVRPHDLSRTSSRPQSRDQSTGRLQRHAKPPARDSSYPPSQSRPDGGRASSAFDSMRQAMDTQKPELDLITTMVLPPPPSEIDDNYDSVAGSVQGLRSEFHSPQSVAYENTITRPTTADQPHLALTEHETQNAVDMFFSVITELYNLSSVWMLRRSLLNIAKSVLLRPGNASLKSIQTVIQESILDANTKDDIVAHHIRQIRLNALPTDEEIKKWKEEGAYDPISTAAKEELRIKARKLIGDKGLPEGLRGLMGGQASREAMEAFFDALQNKAIARGMIATLLAETVGVVCR